MGFNSTGVSRLAHIAELDLTDNLISDWTEVLLLLEIFSNLEFLNLSNNRISEELQLSDKCQSERRTLPLRRLVLNGNRISWSSIAALTKTMPLLEELHLSNNYLDNPTGEFGHKHLRQLFLALNTISSLESVCYELGSYCPNLETLSLANCPLERVPRLDGNSSGFSNLITLNVNATKFNNWSDIDAFTTFSKLEELRVRDCPLLDNYTAHERRMLLVARLPNVAVLNGGDKIPLAEREDAERAFIRYYMDEEEKPQRYHKLVEIHGQLDPLVNISMKPDTHVKVTISAHEEKDVRKEVISVYQTVAQFKVLLQQWFNVPTQNMRLYYCDQVLMNAGATGPEEMKYAQKALYTYSVRDGDSFILIEKSPSVHTPKLKVSNNNSTAATSPIRAHGNNCRQTKGVTFAAISTKTFNRVNPVAKRATTREGASQAARNLFGANNSSRQSSSEDGDQ